MELATLEKGVALIGAIIVGTFAIIALKEEWKLTGLDNQVTKLLLGLMALGCVLVFFTTIGVLGHGG